MVSEEDLYDWKEAIGDFRELNYQNNSLEKTQETDIKNLIKKTKDKNINTRSTQTPHSKPKEIPFDFKLRKGNSLGLDKQADKKLKTGKYPIDLRVDLHGLNLEDSYFKLKDTIDYAFEEGYRLILAITGKGSHSGEGRETIKSSLQSWLSQPELSSKIIKYVDANKKHGGSGAVYILLKRNR